MNKTLLTLLAVFVLACNSTENIETGLAAISDCRKQAAFVASVGMNPQSTAFSTSERKKTGLCLIDLAQSKEPYQHASWADKGNLGPLAIDEQGNCYVAPVPFVNVLEAVRKNQNVIYKVDTQTGLMENLLDLSEKSAINTDNPYGIVGLFYDCSNQLLYASSLQGSTRNEEKGVIYCIDPKSKPAKIIDKLEQVDAMGIGVAFFNDKRTLFYGSARDHKVYRVYLNDEGKFDSKAVFCFSMEGVGGRGDDIVKKIRFSKEGNMQVTGMEFYYNLTAPTEKQESKYEFAYELASTKWQLFKY